ncbi:MAG: bacteriohemerythrin [Spirochaetia bacterium]|nr:bacteriohemerythrin [Spirochaetia bacterium]
MNSVEVFPWNKNLETGLPTIDEQHKSLVQLLNKLAYHVAFQSDVPTLDHVFNELSEYAIYHFHEEESIWEEFLRNDEWEVGHKKTHGSFISEIMAMKSREKSEPLNKVLEDIVAFLTHWLAFHILDKDKQMAKVAINVKSGMSLKKAKNLANKELSGTMKVLIESILLMYDTLTARTLQLLKETIERQKAEAKLRLAADAVEHTLEAICITDTNSNIIEVNPAFYDTTTLLASEVVGKNVKEIKTGLQDEELSSEIWTALNEKGHWSGEVWSRKKNGEIDTEWLTLSTIKNEFGEISNYVGIFSNISSLIQQRSKLELSANYDALTGLPNRLLMADRLAMAISNADRTHCFLAVCYLDLDGFKKVNDSLGHATGDHLLWEIAQRFAKIKRGNDTVARLAGDEFIILLGDLEKPANCIPVLERILEEVKRPVFYKTNIAHVTASIGVTIYPQNSTDPEDLLHQADEAMYLAKKSGKCQYTFYKPSVQIQ